jgi:hypothetical protein
LADYLLKRVENREFQYVRKNPQESIALKHKVTAMGQIFTIDGKWDWDVAMGVSLQIGLNVKFLEERYGFETGIVDLGCDTYDIDSVKFRLFLEKYSKDYFDSNHNAWKAINIGLLCLLAALYKRIFKISPDNFKPVSPVEIELTQIMDAYFAGVDFPDTPDHTIPSPDSNN